MSAPDDFRESRPAKRLAVRRSPRHRRLTIVLTAAVCLLAIEWGVRRGDRALRDYDARRQIHAYARKPEALGRIPMPDVVLMGSSRARYAFVPAAFESVLGMSAYNLAIAGSKPPEWQILARRLLFGRPPRLVVLGVNAGEFRADSQPRAAAEFLFDWRDFAESCRIDGPSQPVTERFVQSRFARASALLNRRHELKMLAQTRLGRVLPKHAQEARELRDRVARPLPGDGYEHPWEDGRRLRTLQDRIDHGDHRDSERFLIPEYEPEAVAFHRFDELLRELHRVGIAVAVAYVPNSPETEARWSEVEPKIVDRIAAICRDRGVSFIDCRMAPFERTNRQYFDEVHVGLPLARCISLHVADAVRSVGAVQEYASSLARLEQDDPDADP